MSVDLSGTRMSWTFTVQKINLILQGTVMWSAVSSCMPTREIWLGKKKITFRAGSYK